MSRKSFLPAAGKPALATGIDASINGEQRRCEIHRADLKFFEAVHGSALAHFNRFREGTWTSEALRAVIEFAARPRQAAEETIDNFGLRFMTSSTDRRRG